LCAVDAAAGVHPVHVAGADRLCGAQSIAVENLAFEQVRHRRQIDVRMRAHIEALAYGEMPGAELVPENERPDHAFFDRRQSTAH